MMNDSPTILIKPSEDEQKDKYPLAIAHILMTLDIGCGYDKIWKESHPEVADVFQTAPKPK
jgi:hypothetical protein